MEQGTNPSTVLGTLESRKFTVSDYLASYKAVQHEIMFLYGEQANRVFPLVNIKGEAWDRLLLLHRAKKDGVRVKDSEVVNWLTRQPVFFTKNQFDPAIYKLYVDQYLRMERRDFEEEIRENLILDRLRAKIRETVRISDSELKDRFIAQNSRRDISYGILPWESEKENVTVTDEETEKMKGLFKNLAQEESPDEIRDLLLRQKASETAAKKMEGWRAAMTTEGFDKILADNGLERKKFEKLDKSSSPPDLGEVSRVERVVEELKEGEISRPFIVPAGAAILKVVKIYPPDEKTFETEKTAFLEKAINDQTTEKLTEILEELRKKLKIDLETTRKIFQTPEEEISKAPIPDVSSLGDF
jgi:hypothetical protein